MTFLKSLFVNKRVARQQLRRYVEMEYKAGEREAAYDRMLRESGLL